VRTTALLPSNYVRSHDLAWVADGCGGGDARLLQKDKVYRSSADDQWVCRPLDRLVSSGQVTLVRRSKGYLGRADDDREILRTARLCNGYVCSNDQFREHFRLKGDEPNRPKVRSALPSRAHVEPPQFSHASCPACPGPGRG
jgi:hypothetical protein